MMNEDAVTGDHNLAPSLSEEINQLRLEVRTMNEKIYLLTVSPEERAEEDKIKYYKEQDAWRKRNEADE